MKWSELCEKVLKSDTMKSFQRLGIKNLNQLDIIKIIMRKDNYYIALFNKDILKIHLPLLSKLTPMTKTLEWGLDKTVFGFVFDNKKQTIKPEFKNTSTEMRKKMAKALRRRFYIFAFVSILLMPIILLFLIIYLFYKYGEELKNKPSTIIQKQWNQNACWKFRYWNELPHLFERRMNNSIQLAINYLNAFKNDVLNIFTTFFAFIFGSFAVVLLLGGLVDPYFLTNIVLVQDKTLLYVLGILLPLLIALRNATPFVHYDNDPNTLMKILQVHIQYFPAHWINNAHTTKVNHNIILLYI